MTAKNLKANAVEVNVLPRGRIISRSGECVEVEESRNISVWYKLAAPKDVGEAETLIRNQQILRRVDDVFLIDDGTHKWVRLTPPKDTGKLKTYFLVMKVPHETIILRPDVILLKYKRDGTMEWVRNIQVAEKISKRDFKSKPFETVERRKQVEAGKQMMLAEA